MNIEKITTLISNIKDFKALPKDHPNYDYLIKQVQDLEKLGLKSILPEEFFEKITSSKNLNLLFDNLQNIKMEYIYTSFCHGINHNIRVALLSFYLANCYGLDNKMTTLALYGAMYHDIGRVNDEEDAKHGMRSAKMLDKLGLGLEEEELKILKTAIISHSIPDEKFVHIAKKMKVKDIENCTILFKILKDADGLDRVRLDYPCVGYNFLRSEISKQLVPFSYSLEYNYGGLYENNCEKAENHKNKR